MLGMEEVRSVKPSVLFGPGFEFDDKSCPCGKKLIISYRTK